MHTCTWNTNRKRTNVCVQHEHSVCNRGSSVHLGWVFLMSGTYRIRIVRSKFYMNSRREYRREYICMLLVMGLWVPVVNMICKVRLQRLHGEGVVEVLHQTTGKD